MSYLRIISSASILTAFVESAAMPQMGGGMNPGMNMGGGGMYSGMNMGGGMSPGMNMGGGMNPGMMGGGMYSGMNLGGGMSPGMMGGGMNLGGMGSFGGTNPGMGGGMNPALMSGAGGMNTGGGGIGPFGFQLKAGQGTNNIQGQGSGGYGMNQQQPSQAMGPFGFPITAATPKTAKNIDAGPPSILTNNPQRPGNPGFDFIATPQSKTGAQGNPGTPVTAAIPPPIVGMA